MQSRKSAQKAAAALFLIAIGVVIPAFSPLKLLLEPASFTLASHAPIFIAMFISPGVTIAVAAGSAVGFFVGGSSQVIILRAASHVLFALLGSCLLDYNPRIVSSRLRMSVFAAAISVIHALAEVAVVEVFFMSGGTVSYTYTTSAIWLLIGLGGFIHSLIDFVIAVAVLKLLTSRASLRSIFIQV
ncbi:MAG: hypothetical protein LBN97_07875 [Oscillospiraceae bacterium]|jgi:niacin transporter|nr:hypothetical protein [Oscillospiraceae bacterium]